MKSLLLAVCAALICSPALAGTLVVPEVGQGVEIGPPGVIICDTLEQLQAVAADANKPEVFMALRATIDDRGEPTCDFGGGGGIVSRVVNMPEYDLIGIHVHPYAVLVVVAGGIERWILLPIPQAPAARVVPGKGA